MATLREYYEKDLSHLLRVSSREFKVHTSGGEATITPQVHLDFVANAKYVSCYLPGDIDPVDFGITLIKDLQSILASDEGAVVLSGYPGSTQKDCLDCRDLQFTGRVFLYSEDCAPEDRWSALDSEVRPQGLSLVLRTPEYAEQRSSWETPLAFISHDARDKDTVARAIAVGLQKRLCPVWYDEFSLKVGDSLRESIEKGLKECRKCVLILSQNFLANSGWTKAEFNSLFTRELIEGSGIILPVWVDVNRDDVYAYSPNLANKFALQWTSGEEKVVERLHAAIISKPQPN